MKQSTWESIKDQLSPGDTVKINYNFKGFQYTKKFQISKILPYGLSLISNPKKHLKRYIARQMINTIVEVK